MNEIIGEEEFLRKVVRYLEEPENTVLETEVTQLRTLHPEFELLFEQVTAIWSVSSAVSPLQEMDTDKAVKRFTDRLSFVAPEQSRQSSFNWKWLMRAAAIVVIGIGGYFVYHTSTAVSYITETTLAANATPVKLTDGTTITLDSYSSLRYPDKLKGETREVYLLDGTAFFDVIRNEEHPFIVNIGQSKVTVLGTSFNIEVNTETIELNVETGRVEFETREGGEKTIVNAGSGLVYNKATRSLKTFASGNRNSSSWLSRELTFHDAPLSDVFESIETLYNVSIEVDLDDSLTAYRKLNASFKDDSLDEVLDVLAALYPIEITRQDSTLTVRSK